MRNFIVSDLHGNGNVYESIINYLNNVDSNDNVTLYINGDLIDVGCEAGVMLLDVYERITNNKGFKIEYLAGNHELMMYNASKRLKKDKSFDSLNDVWRDNGSTYTTSSLEMYISWEEQMKICEFISNLNLYHKFDEKMNNKNILLVHARCPININDECNLKIKDTTTYYKNNIIKKENIRNGKKCYITRETGDYEYSLSDDVFVSTWARTFDPYFKHVVKRLGNDNYFTIIGHTPNFNHPGFSYDNNDNVLNIDGSSREYMSLLQKKYLQDDELNINELSWDDVEIRHKSELEKYDHVPLVEIQDNKLKILIFNRFNQIIDGYYFYNQEINKISEEELNIDRKVLTKDKGYSRILRRD